MLADLSRPGIKIEIVLLCRHRRRSVALRPTQDGLNDPRILVGQRYGRAVVSASGDKFLQPQTACIFAARNPDQNGARPVDQQPPQVVVSPLADAEQARLSA